MDRFYVIYKYVGLIFGDIGDHTYEIYDNEEGFLIALSNFIEGAKLSYCDIDDEEDDEETMSRLLEACDYDDEEYDTYTKLIAEKMHNPSKDNGLYDRLFNFFDIVIRIDMATKDYKEFMDVMFDILREETGLLDTDDEQEKNEILDANPMVKYLMAMKASNAYPTEADFKRQFDKLESDINKHAKCLLSYYR